MGQTTGQGHTAVSLRGCLHTRCVAKGAAGGGEKCREWTGGVYTGMCQEQIPPRTVSGHKAGGAGRRTVGRGHRGAYEVQDRCAITGDTAGGVFTRIACVEDHVVS